MILTIKKIFPFIIFTIFLLLIVCVILFYSPSWGLMDDCGNLERAQRVWNSDNCFKSLWDIIVNEDLLGWGMFRPVYYTWVVFMYQIFRDAPLAFYIVITIFNMILLPLWGLVLYRLYGVKNENKMLCIFLFPLSFFIFSPFCNIFMYISVQEKFIIFFSLIALYFFERAYSKNRCIYLFPLTLAVLLNIFSNPRGAYLAIVFTVYSFLDLIIFRSHRYVSAVNLIMNLFLLVSYSLFTIKLQCKGSYTSTYVNNLNLANIFNNLLKTSVVMQILVIVAFFTIICLLIRRKKSLFIVIPLCFLSYILILSPWGLLTYHLSAVTPYVLGMAFPIYSWINERSVLLKLISNSLVILLVFISFFYIIVPRISKMADIKMTKEFIINFNKGGIKKRFFLPYPSLEAAVTLGKLSKADIVYLENGVLESAMLKNCSANYLIFRDECLVVSLKGVAIGNEIYQNRTWEIYDIHEKKDNSGEFRAKFYENPIERLKTYLK